MILTGETIPTYDELIEMILPKKLNRTQIPFKQTHAKHIKHYYPEKTYDY